MEKQIGVDARHLLEVAAENKHRGVRKFPDRLPKTAKFLVGVLRDLVADEEVVPRKTQAERKQRIAAMGACRYKQQVTESANRDKNEDIEKVQRGDEALTERKRKNMLLMV